MSDSQILVSRELLRNVKREVDDLRDERDVLLARLASAGGADDLRAALDAARTELTQTQSALAQALDEIDRLRASSPAPFAAPAGMSEPVRASAPDTASAAAPDAEARTPGPVGVAGDAFVAWCGRNRALVSRPTLFAAFLKGEAGGAEVEVSPVYRDRGSSRPTFRAETVDGVEYWLVRVGSATVLFPQPLSAAQFRELSPCFDGAATPETLADIRPARVSAEAGVHVLTSAGRVTATDL